MENSLWTFGCSFTAEYQPLDNVPPNNYDLYKEYKGGSLPSVWPTLLSEKLKLNCENKGYGARSNYTIFYTFCNWCSKIKKGDTVIFQWTTPYRFLFANVDSNGNFLHDILPSVNYSKEYNMNTIEDILVNRTNPIWMEELISFTKIINEVCKEKGASIYYWTYHEDEILSYMSTNWDEYDKNKVITWTSEKGHQSLLNYLHTKTNNLHTILAETEGFIDDDHLGEFGHKTQSEYFYNFIKNKL